MAGGFERFAPMAPEVRWLGAEAALSFDSRDTARRPPSRTWPWRERLPPLWDVTSTFGEVQGEAATY